MATLFAKKTSGKELPIRRLTKHPFQSQRIPCSRNPLWKRTFGRTDDKFIDLQTKFLDQNCKHFTNDDENKLIYMDIFNQYTNLLEKYIEKRLCQNIPGFSMPEFLNKLKYNLTLIRKPTLNKTFRLRSDQVDGDVFEMLSSVGDFNTFKEVMLSYKDEKEGTSIDLSGLLAVSSSAKKK
ncbi:ADP-ribosylation factor-like protein 2-binding protein [Phlyctochytrium planicorne]|nr:ADP-ribosylation factor-like protein 2-binding protein [Phlyctochytrium planicorne]